MKFSLFSAALLASNIASAAIPVNGWYASAFGGYAYFPDNISRHVNGLFVSRPSYHNGFNAGARLGYQSTPMRYELEYTYLQANIRNIDVNFVNQLGITGKADANVAMANIYYDFPDVLLPTISPFIGLGIGYAYLQVTVNSTTPIGGISFNRVASSFAYQGTAGLTYNFAENWSLNASYRYLATTSSNRFGKNFQAQIGDVGIVYRFDRCD